jgi:DNA-binding transcriptional LysR family regulator
MELRQLEYFVAVAEERSFTKAAARVHVAQPGVSAQVRRLEEELGQELLDRSGRTVSLTQVGAAMLPYARSALAAVSGARGAVDELTGLTSGHVAVGMVTACAALDVPELLAAFRRQHPGVGISLSEADAGRLLEDLQAGRLDLAWVALGTADPPGLQTRTLSDEPLVAAVAHGHPLAGRRSIGVARLREQTLISMPRGTGIRTILDDGCAAVGFRPQVTLEANSPPMLAQLAARGLGVAILPQSVAAAYPDELHALAVERPRLRGRLALAWRAGPPSSPAARALIEHARTVV